jgi:hypothetical protein
MKKNFPVDRRSIFPVTILLLFIMLNGCHTDTPQTEEFVAVDKVTEYWVPSIGDRLQIQYADYPPDLSMEADIYALDLFEAPQSSIAELHAKGKKVICYVNTGAWEEYRPDADDFPSESIGRDYEGWPGEKWLDIGRYETFAGIMQARFDLAVEKGCDGIDADNMQNYEEHTGFDIRPADQMEYNLWLSEQSHQRGLSIGLKNDAEQAADLAACFDWSLIEDCSVYGWCQMLSPFIEAHKPVFQIEYTDMDLSLQSFCPTANELGFSGLLKRRGLDAWVEFCP